jgi:hypothetical protein
MSKLFRTKDSLTIAQLTATWSSELVGSGEDPGQCEQNLLHVLMEDIVNGHLDNSGPLRDDGQRLGLRLITSENRAGLVEGRELLDLLRGGEAYVLHRVVVMKEAALDFAQRHQLPPPTWWTGSPSTPSEVLSTTVRDVAPSAAKVDVPPSRGKQPRILDYLSKHFPDGVPEPGLCPRHILKSDILKWDPRLRRLDEATLKKAIEKHNESLAKQKT